MGPYALPNSPIERSLALVMYMTMPQTDTFHIFESL